MSCETCENTEVCGVCGVLYHAEQAAGGCPVCSLEDKLEDTHRETLEVIDDLQK